MGSKPLSPRGVSKLVISNLSCYMGNKIDFMGNLEVIFFPSGYLELVISHFGFSHGK